MNSQRIIAALLACSTLPGIFALPAFAGDVPGYIGSGITTLGKSNYGKWEARIRFAGGSAMMGSIFAWDKRAFTTEGTLNSGYITQCNPWSNGTISAQHSPYWHEIDIEYFSQHPYIIEPGILMHGDWASRYCADNNGFICELPVQKDIPFNASEEYHDYALEVTPEYVGFACDGQVIYTRQKQSDNDIMVTGFSDAELQVLFMLDVNNYDGSFNAGAVPLYSIYSWYKFYNYTPGQGENGSDWTLGIVDNFDGSSLDSSIWEATTDPNVVVRDGKVILCFTTESQRGFSGQVPVDQLDTGIPTGIVRTNSQSPSAAMSLQQNSGAISLRLSHAGTVRIGLYDLQGKFVRSIVEQQFTSGATALDVNRATLPAGAYLLRANLLNMPGAAEAQSLVMLP